MSDATIHSKKLIGKIGFEGLEILYVQKDKPQVKRIAKNLVPQDAELNI